MNLASARRETGEFGGALRPELIRAKLTRRERDHLVHWWIHRSGLTRSELRAIATAIWTDRLMDVLANNDDWSRRVT